MFGIATTARERTADDTAYTPWTRFRDGLTTRLASWGAALRRRWQALDRQAWIRRLVEEPGACLLHGLKLGRFPYSKQLQLRDDNTVAGMVAWIVVASALLAALLSAL